MTGGGALNRRSPVALAGLPVLASAPARRSAPYAAWAAYATALNVAVVAHN